MLYLRPPGPRIPPPLDNTEQPPTPTRQGKPAIAVPCWDSGTMLAPGAGVQAARRLSALRADGTQAPDNWLHVQVKP